MHAVSVSLSLSFSCLLFFSSFLVLFLTHCFRRYATSAYLAGVDPSDDVSGVPPIDSLNVWPALTSNISSPRTEIPLAFCNADAQCDEPMQEGALPDAALIVGDYKIVTGYQGGLGMTKK